jgi:putative transposase
MGSTFYSLHYHVVFSTKNRAPILKPEWKDRAYEYIGGTIRGLGGVAESIGGVADHVHLLISLKTTHAPAEVVREFKKASSVWINENFDTAFNWQEGYAIFSVSPTHTDAVRQYIAGQEAHHRKLNFRGELEELLKKNGVKYERKYLS